MKGTTAMKPALPIGLKNIDHFIITAGSTCANCQYRKELCSGVPKACADCSFLPERDKAYFSLLPVWKEGHSPTKQENTAAFWHIERLERLPRKDLPDYCVELTA